MCIRWFKQMFKREVTKAEVTRTEAPKKETQRGFLRKFPAGKMSTTSRGGLNMPRYQPCPQCNAGSKRQEKALSGADYRCRKHGSFFVGA